jgi:vesicular inhibitory amino acid transporter
VGLVTSVTYLTCAYTIPAWFTLRLLGRHISAAERALCYAIVPASIAFSALGFSCSIYALVQNLGGGEL